MTPQELQRDTALTKANEIRIRRARVKEAVARGELRAYEVTPENEPLLAGMKVADLLLATPSVGRDKLREWCKVALITERTEFRFLSASQRARITVLVDAHYKRSSRAQAAEAEALARMATAA